MVFVELNGRLGNFLFQIATAASLAKKNNCKFAVICHDRYELPGNQSIYQYFKQFQDSIFKEISVCDSLPSDIYYFRQEEACYKSIKYRENIYLHGTFQSEKFFCDNYTRRLFQIPSSIEYTLNQRYKCILEQGATSIHVRRGDYLKRPHEYNIASMSFFNKAINMIGKDTNFIVISDDLKWCKKKFKGNNYYFVNNSILEDLYLQSLCTNNIISNSTFSWWGAWLNQNPNKIVISPKPWYGKSNKSIDTSDLIPNNWLQVNNKMSLSFTVLSQIHILFKYLENTYYSIINVLKVIRYRSNQ